jgi:hypothetical protein
MLGSGPKGGSHANSENPLSVRKADNGYIDPRHVRAVNDWLAKVGILSSCYVWREPGSRKWIIACWRFRAAQSEAAEAFAAKWLHGLH